MSKSMKYALPMVLLFAALLMIYDGFEPIQDPGDIFWHARLGLDFVKTGFAAYLDHYSFTMPLHPIETYAVPFEVLAGLSYSGFGFAGFQVLRVSTWLLSLIMFHFGCRKTAIRAELEMIGAAFLTFAFISRPSVRPFMVGLPFLLAIAFVYLRNRETFKFRTALQMSVIFLVWNLIHSSALVAYPIIGAYMINWFVNLCTTGFKDFKNFTKASVVVLLFGWMPWRGTHSVLLFLSFDSHWAKLIHELQPTDLQMLPTTYYIYLYLAAMTILRRVYKRDAGSTILLASFGWQFFKTTFMVPICLVATLPLVLQDTAELLGALAEMASLRDSLKKIITKLFLVGLPLAVFAECVYFIQAEPVALGLDSTDIPVEIVKNLQEQKAHGNMLADFDSANYVLFTMGDEMKVYLDGRTNILYPPDQVLQYYRLSLIPEAFKAEVESRHIDYVLTRFATDAADFYFSALKSREFEISQVTETQMLFTKTDHRFENLTELARRPESFGEISPDRIRKEIEVADQSWSPRSRELFLIDLLKKALDHKEPMTSQFFQENESLIEGSDPNTRLASYLAEKASIPHLPFFLYTKLQHPKADDYMKMAELAQADDQRKVALALVEKVPDTSGADLIRRKLALVARGP